MTQCVVAGQSPGSSDQRFPINKVPDLLPPGITGRPIARSTVGRWTTVGVAGVRLRTERIGGRYYTRDSWVQDFLAALNADGNEGTLVDAAANRGCDDAGII